MQQGFPGGSDGKESAHNAGDLSSIPGLERSPGEGNGYPLQYFCLEKSMDRRAWWATVHRVTKSEYDWTTSFTLANNNNKTHKSTTAEMNDLLNLQIQLLINVCFISMKNWIKAEDVTIDYVEFLTNNPI